jgi:acyl dehydratase
MKTKLDTLDALHAFVFSKSGASASGEWLTVTQEMINQFATLTLDEQWIHVDAARAAQESPFKHPVSGERTTVAHGFLTLSLISHFLGSALEMPPLQAAVNYGCNKMRFTSPVPAGSRVRGVVKLLGVESAGAMLQLTWDIAVEIEGAERPAIAAEWLTRILPK